MSCPLNDNYCYIFQLIKYYNCIQYTIPCYNILFANQIAIIIHLVSLMLLKRVGHPAQSDPPPHFSHQEKCFLLTRYFTMTKILIKSKRVTGLNLIFSFSIQNIHLMRALTRS